MAQDDPDYPKFFLHDLRFNEDGSEKDFIFNTPPFNEAKILVTDVNWGCGSSRENAVYADGGERHSFGHRTFDCGYSLQ